MTAAALMAIGLAFASGCNGGDPPGNTAPTTPSPQAPDVSQWLTYSNQQYGVSLRYPPSYKVVVPSNPLQPPPLFRVGFQLVSLTNPAGPEPPQFAIDVYDNASGQSLDQWLSTSGVVVSYGTSSRDAVQIGGVNGVRIAYQTLMAPNTFNYVARGAFVYRFTPMGTYSDQMLDTVQFTQ
jgi:hypothetical protein